MISTSLYSKTITIKSETYLAGAESWQFETQDDGMFFILGPEDTRKLVIHVKPYLANGKEPDTVYLSCNARQYHLKPNATVICKGNFADIIWMGILPEDFKNGAEGSYTFVS